MPAYQPPASQYRCLSAEEAASRADDHGRKLHELRWLYLDSVGQEFGPLPGWTMQEWLTMGRFPVGLDLRVRLPEWDRHLPLRQIFPDLSAAFRLPPAWPDACNDGKTGAGSQDVEELRRSIRESGRMSGPFHGCVPSSPATTVPSAIPSSSVSFAPPVSVNGSAVINGVEKAGRPERNKIPSAEPQRDLQPKAVLSRPVALPLPPREATLPDRDELPPLPKAQSVLERLLQQEQQELRLHGQMNGQTKDSARLFLEKVSNGVHHGPNGKVEVIPRDLHELRAATGANGNGLVLLQ
mmetsp:Transcript_37884/g.70654  ORF Transcript_37884/g.70654 Transcript_37884/m.70654 type:complete len:296 (-) Transcript_37884:22-909(-)